MSRILVTMAMCACLAMAAPPAPQASASTGGFAYIGTLDRKLLVFDENKEEVVGEIQLGGIPRVTALSPDQTKLHILTTQMDVETVDLPGRKMITHFSLSDEKSRPRIARSGGNAIAVDPNGRFLYATF